MIIGDSHGHITNIKHVVGFAKKDNVSAIIHAGDWDTSEAVDAVTSFGIPLYTVLGNADVRPEVGERLKVKGKKFDDKFLIINLGGRKIGITHKPSDNKKYFLGKKLDLDLIVNGHLHSKYESLETPIKIIRPGAVIKGSNFAIFDTASNRVEFIEDVET